MASPASIRKHPIHPLLVPLPIGLWIFSLACDVLYLTLSSDTMWDRMAFVAMAGGVVGALAAAVPGFIDFLSLREPRVKRIALTHMIINLTVVALFAVNLWLRTRTAPGGRTPIALSAVAVVLLGISGWLGGELVFRHGVAVDTTPPGRR